MSVTSVLQPVADSRRRRPGQAGPATVAVTQVSRFDRFLLVVLVFALAFEESLPRVGPVSVGFVLFAFVGLFTFLRRQRALAIGFRHPVTLAFIFLVVVGIGFEVIRQVPTLVYVRRIGLMALGAVLVATLVRDRVAMRTGLLAFTFVALIFAGVVAQTGGRELYAETAGDYFAATAARIDALRDLPIRGNLNRMGFIVGIGGVIGFVVAGTMRRRWQQRVVRLVGALCILGMALLASRSAIVVTLAAVATLVVMRGEKRARGAFGAAILLTMLWFLIPDVTRARLSYGETSKRGREDGRAKMYRMTVVNLPEVLPFGVGENRYWNEWATDVLGRRLGTHSSLLQVIVLWGIPGLVGLVLVGFAVLRSLPDTRVRDPLRLCAWAMAAAVGTRWMATHGMYDKEFSVLLGILIGASIWIWPRPKAATLSSVRRLPPPAVGVARVVDLDVSAGR